MSPKNQGVFSSPERGDFSKNADVLQFVRRVPFVCDWWAGGGGTGSNGIE